MSLKEVTFKTAVDQPDSPRSISPRSQSQQQNASSDLRLPPEVNFVALRETFLSEAPFIKRSNRNFWKKWIDSKQYYNVLAASFMIVADSIADNGNILMRKLYELREDNQFLVRLAKNISEMMIMDRSNGTRSHDSFFARLPELLCYMITNSLLSMAPKSSRVFFSVKFREVLLDWLSELIYGIRITNSKYDREWLFKDANDVPILVVDSNVGFSFSPARKPLQLEGEDTQSMGATLSLVPSPAGKKRATSLFFAGTGYSSKGNNATFQSMMSGSAPNGSPPGTAMVSMTSANATTSGGGNGAIMLASTTNHRQPLPAIQTRYSAAQSVQTLSNSPLIRISMNLDRQGRNEPPYLCTHALRLTLSSMPERDLFPMQERMCETMSQSQLSPVNTVRAGSASFNSTTGTNASVLSATTNSRPSSEQARRLTSGKEGYHLKFRERKMDHDRLCDTISTTYSHRKVVLADKDKIIRDHRRGMHHLSHALKLQLGILEKQYKKKKITQQELLAEASAVERARFKPKEAEIMDGTKNVT